MKIAVNTRLLLHEKLDGIGWFTYQTLKRIVRNHPEHQFVFLFDRTFDREFVFQENVLPVVVSPPARHPILWYFWFQWMLPRVLKRFKADVFLSPDGFTPLNIKIPVVAVIHDINFQHRPKDVPLTSRLYYRHFFPKFATAARRILTVSEYSKRDISASYNVSPNKIDVIYNGAHESYRPLSDTEKMDVRKNYTEGCEYFIFVGSLHPRKNVDGLLKGFELFKKATSSVMKLVIVGEKYFMYRSLEQIYDQMKYRSDVIFTGRKEPQELSRLVGASFALAFVPHFEGFGIPLLEAMNCDIPSVASNTSSIPEIAQDTAIYVNPADVNSISNGLEKMARDSSLRLQLIQNCKRQREQFSWDATADRLWLSIEQVTR